MVDLEVLYKVAASAAPMLAPIDATKGVTKRTKIGVAYDEAFSFYYPASLSALEAQGAELVYFSPLKDNVIPDVDGLVFGGGFPEMFLQALSENTAMKESIRKANQRHMPIYAECGGLMYLCEHIHDFGGNVFDTVGVVPAYLAIQEQLCMVMNSISPPWNQPLKISLGPFT